ncbi:hypothetical protein [Scytonema sp. UIC 10036]|nr:hypothetical protein [Scytonema sp. UIC 10036]
MAVSKYRDLMLVAASAFFGNAFRSYLSPIVAYNTNHLGNLIR